MIPIRDNLSCKSPALATRALILLNILAFVVQTLLPESHQEWFFKTFLVVPANITEAFTTLNLAGMGMGLLSLLTATFLHGGLAHIFGNMIFLNAFGKSVENRLGPWRFVWFYLLGGCAAWGYHFMIDPWSTTPALGASGAIAAVLGMYLLFYPRAEFMTLIMAGPYPMLVNIRAYWFLPVWFLGQIVPGISELLRPAVGAGIAYWAHIGGFVAGLSLAAYWTMRKPVSDVCYSPFVCRCGHDDCHKNGFSLSNIGNLFRRNRNSDCEHGCATPKRDDSHGTNANIVDVREVSEVHDEGCCGAGDAANESQPRKEGDSSAGTGGGDDASVRPESKGSASNSDKPEGDGGAGSSPRPEGNDGTQPPR